MNKEIEINNAYSYSIIPFNTNDTEWQNASAWKTVYIGYENDIIEMSDLQGVLDQLIAIGNGWC